MNESSRQLEILKKAVRQPVRALTMVEMDVAYASDLIQSLKIDMKERPRDVLRISPGPESPYLLLTSAREATEAWPDDVGVLFIVGENGLSEPGRIGFWRELNQQRECWGALNCHVIFLLRPPGCRSLLIHAGHLAAWIPLKLHLMESFNQSFPGTPPMFEDPILFRIPGSPEIARIQIQTLESRLSEASGRGEDPGALFRRYHLPIFEAALMVGDFNRAKGCRDRAREGDALNSDLPQWLLLNFILEFHLGNLSHAEQWAVKTFEWAKGHGDTKSEALSYYQRGLIAEEKWNHARNRDHFEQSGEIVKKLSPDVWLVNTYNELGRIALGEKNLHGAQDKDHASTRVKKFFEKSIELFEKFPYSSEPAWVHYKTGAMALEEMNLKKAEKRIQKTLTIFNRPGNAKGKIPAIHLSGVIALEKGAFSNAKECFLESLEIALGQENAYGAAINYQGMGRIAFEEKQFFKAGKHLAKALEIFEKLNHVHGKAIACRQLGILAREQGRLEHSIDFLIQSLETTMKSIKNGSSARAETATPWKAFVDLMYTYVNVPEASREHLKKKLQIV